MQIVQHISKFTPHDTADRAVVDFSTLDELLQVPFVSRWTELLAFKGFVRVCDRLVACIGTSQWVVGTFSGGGYEKLAIPVHEVKFEHGHALIEARRVRALYRDLCGLD